MADALEGVKCVCVIMFQQTPVAFSMMADLGAEVIKIEPPEGELGRQLGVAPGFPLSPYFETNNRGFKCITLDLKTEKAREILYKLVKDADVFAQNFRPGVAERLGCGYEDLVKINPGIVYLSASAYGPDGPNAKLPGTDGIAQAMGGICFSYGEEGSRVTTGQISVGDETAAFHNFQAVIIALYHKLKTGEGQLIETSLLGSQIRLMGHSMSRVLMTGEQMSRSRMRFYRRRALAERSGEYRACSRTGQSWLCQVGRYRCLSREKKDLHRYYGQAVCYQYQGALVKSTS
jgi:crotonobetainyl-CoA:carnitine CoA-transferase CaiB-like acyl-CoA transferase